MRNTFDFYHLLDLSATCVLYFYFHVFSCSENSPNLDPLPHPDQSHSAPFSSENGAKGGDSDAWQCTPPQSTSPSGETPAHPPPSQPGSRPRSRPASQSPSPPSALNGTKKRNAKPAHIRRNIRYSKIQIYNQKLTRISTSSVLSKLYFWASSWGCEFL